MKCQHRRPGTMTSASTVRTVHALSSQDITRRLLNCNGQISKRVSGNINSKCRQPRGVSRYQIRADVNWDAFRGDVPGVQLLIKNVSLQKIYQYDFLIIGSGIAGLTYALKVAEFGKVAVLAKEEIEEGSTRYAQGGVCSVLHPLDSVEAHTQDTIVAGAFLNNEQVVKMVCREGPERVLELAQMGANFTKEASGNFHLTKEGGHSHRRIVHAADATGKEIQETLVRMTRSHPNIDVYEHHFAKDLVVDEVGGQMHCFGVDVINDKEQKLVRFVSPVTMLSTGGIGWVYPQTTNPRVTTGDGIAMAFRAGAQVANMEFVQFHPTSLYNPDSSGVNSAFLISEAVRGEGGMLLDAKGTRFMHEYDPRLELAPRDVVARSIQSQMLRTEQPHVWLDISHKPSREITSHFPTIYSRCLDLGIDITKDPIPVVPAQHYMCGGVVSGMQGETNVQGLFACGEVACTGLHGANRLASNSLLEGLVFAHRAVQPSVAHVEYAYKNCTRNIHYAAAAANSFGDVGIREFSPHLQTWVMQNKQMLQTTMWEKCGIVRRRKEMKAGLSDLAGLYLETKLVNEMFGAHKDLLELLNLVTVGELIMASALARRESRGLHFCQDFPEPVEREKHSTLIEWKSLKTQLQRLKKSSGLATKKKGVGRLSTNIKENLMQKMKPVLIGLDGSM
eukprot:TRINITY_DN10754_c0_g2_i1.p1 TRINITY_DN10754_c0_g2~~TRINITY_DN10754_c0_g2_i1.p1  ORF type:complete len:676 (-),score=55.77 TRINITY_DN10754_c0_g2_i1:169-2196(-)